jgi:hypothetical protein
VKDGTIPEVPYCIVLGELSVSVLDDYTIRSLFLRAWLDSQPGTAGAHEEGGFVVRNTDGSLEVERWPVGAQNQISVPPHAGGRRGHRSIVATFHTHPNPGPDFQQEPSLTDIRGVRDDPDLSHADYEGEYVLSADWIYVIRRNGRVELVGETNAVLKIN